MHNLSKAVKITPIMIGIAAGATAHNSDVVDMRGFEGVAFVANLGTITTANLTNLHIEAGSDSGLSSAGNVADLKNSAAFFDSTLGSSAIWLVTEVYRPSQRYVRAVVDRSVANAVINGVIALQYRAVEEAVTETTTVADYTLLVTPATGSATG